MHKEQQEGVPVFLLMGLIILLIRHPVDPEVEDHLQVPEEEDRLEVPEVEGRPTDLIKTMERQKAKEKKWEEECPAEEL
jgi:hypothetical protein